MGNQLVCMLLTMCISEWKWMGFWSSYFALEGVLSMLEPCLLFWAYWGELGLCVHANRRKDQSRTPCSWRNWSAACLIGSYRWPVLNSVGNLGASKQGLAYASETPAGSRPCVGRQTAELRDSYWHRCDVREHRSCSIYGPWYDSMTRRASVST